MDMLLKILILFSHADGKAKFHEMSIHLENLKRKSLEGGWVHLLSFCSVLPVYAFFQIWCTYHCKKLCIYNISIMIICPFHGLLIVAAELVYN